jgi:entericidin B
MRYPKKPKGKTMNRFVLATLALLLTAVTAGCNTIQGIGTDIKQGGESIQKAATQNK